jgi:hypothetical protein
VVGATVRLVGIPPGIEHNEGIQIDSAATTGMSKVVQTINLISDSCWFVTKMLNLILARSMARTEQLCTSPMCPPMIGQSVWMRGNPA